MAASAMFSGAVVDVEEIDDFPEADAIHEVADRPAKDQRQADAALPISNALFAKDPTPRGSS
jgi:hypothetical protein